MKVKLTPMRTYAATIKLRREWELKPEAEGLDGLTVTTRCLWEIGPESSLYRGEYAMDLPDHLGLSWIASGDLVDIKEVN